MVRFLGIVIILYTFLSRIDRFDRDVQGDSMDLKSHGLRDLRALRSYAMDFLSGDLRDLRAVRGCSYSF